MEMIELRSRAQRLAAEVKSKNDTIQPLGVQRETTNAQGVPSPVAPPAKSSHQSVVASPSNALAIANETENGTAQAQGLALLPELRSSTGKDGLGVDDLVEEIFGLETPVGPPVVQDPTIVQL